MKTTKTTIISGGTRGIGLAIAKTLAKQGYQIATFARTQEQIDTFPGKLAEYDIPVWSALGDAQDDQFLKDFVSEVKERFGSIDILINNAGGGRKGSVLELAIEDWDFTLNTNLRATMLLSKLCLPEILKSENGAIINIASIAGRMSFAQSSSYCASKHGVMALTESLFEEVRDHGVKVSAICPGYVDTDLVPNRKTLNREKMIQTEDIAKTVDYILGCSKSSCPVEIIIRPQTNPFE